MEAPRISKEELKTLLDDPWTAVIDVRGKPETGKIPGANIENADNAEIWMNKYIKDDSVVLYCASENEQTSAGIAQKIMENGFNNIYALKGGWKEWTKANYPLEPLSV